MTILVSIAMVYVIQGVETLSSMFFNYLERASKGIYPDLYFLNILVSVIVISQDQYFL